MADFDIGKFQDALGVQVPTQGAPVAPVDTATNPAFDVNAFQKSLTEALKPTPGANWGGLGKGNPFGPGGVIPNDIGAHLYHGFAKSVTSPASILATPIGWINKRAGATVKNFLEVNPDVTPANTFGEKVAEGGGSLLGMAVPTSALKYLKWAEMLPEAGKVALVGAAWGLTKDSGEAPGSAADMAARVKGAIGDATMFTAFHMAGTPAEWVAKKIPGVEEALRKMTPDHAKVLTSLYKNGVLMGGMGAMEPADSLQQRIANMGVGAASGMLAELPFMKQIGLQGLNEDTHQKYKDFLSDPTKWSTEDKAYMAKLGVMDQTSQTSPNRDNIAAMTADVEKKANAFQEGLNKEAPILTTSEELAQKFPNDLSPALSNKVKRSQSTRRNAVLRRWEGVQSPDKRQGIIDTVNSSLGAGTFENLPIAQQESILAQGGWDPNELHNYQKSKIALGGDLNNEDYRTVSDSQQGYQILDRKDMKPKDLALYILDNPDLFPKGVDNLKIRQHPNEPDANFRLRQENLRSAVGGELKDARKNNVSPFPTPEVKPVGEPVVPPAPNVPADNEKAIADKIIAQMKAGSPTEGTVGGDYTKQESEAPETPGAHLGGQIAEALKQAKSPDEAREILVAAQENTVVPHIGKEKPIITLDKLQDKIKSKAGWTKEEILAEKRQQGREAALGYPATGERRLAGGEARSDVGIHNDYQIKEAERLAHESKLNDEEEANIKYQAGVNVEEAIHTEAQANIDSQRNSVPREIGHDASYDVMDIPVDENGVKNLGKLLERMDAKTNYEERKRLADYIAKDPAWDKLTPEEKVHVNQILNTAHEKLNPEQEKSEVKATTKIVNDMLIANKKPQIVSIADLSAEFAKTGKPVRFFYGGVPHTYLEATINGIKTTRIYDDKILENPAQDVRLPIQGELNDPDTAMSGTIGWRKMDDHEALREEANKIEQEKDPAVQEYMRASLALRAQSGSWLNDLKIWAAKKMPGLAQSMSVGKKIDPKIVEKLSQPLDGLNRYTDYKMIGIQRSIEKDLIKAGFTTEDSHKLILNAMLKTHIPDPSDPSKWMMARGTTPEDRIFVKMFESQHPDLFKNIVLRYKGLMDKSLMDWVRSSGGDLDKWEEKRQNGYAPFSATKTDEEVLAGIQNKYGLSADGARARWENMKNNKTIEDFQSACDEVGLLPEWNVGALIGNRIGDGLKRLGMVEIIKDLRGWKSPEGKYNMFEVPRPGVTGKELRDAGYIEAGKSIRWLNYVLPNGAQLEAYVHPDIAKEFKYLYEGGKYGTFGKNYRALQGAVKNIILWHPLFVLGHTGGPVSSMLGMPEYLRVMKESTNLKTFFGKEEVPFIADEQARATAMKDGLVIGKEASYNAVFGKMQEAGKFFKDQQSKKSLLDLAKDLGQDHFGMNKWMWSLVDNYNMAMYTKIKENFAKKGFAPDVAGKWAAQVANDAISNLPARIWSRDTGKLMGLALLAKSYTTATLRLATGAVPFLEKIPWRPLHHDISSPIARAEAAKIYQGMVVKQAVGLIITSNLIQLAFTGTMSVDNEQGHKFDIKTPFTKPNGTPIYVNVPVYRQFDSMIKMLPEFIGDAAGLKGETSSTKWFGNKMDPVTKEVMDLLSNYDSRMHQEIVSQGAPTVDQATERLMHIIAHLQPLPIGKQWTTPAEKALALTGASVTSGYPGGDEARRLQEGIDAKKWAQTKQQRQMGTFEPGSQDVQNMIMEMMITGDKSSAVKNYFLKSTNPLLYKQIRARAMRVF